MKRVFYIVVAIFLAFCVFGCTDKMEKTFKDIQSDMVGLNRKITLYADNGSVIRVWEGKFRIERKGSSIYFINNGKSVVINGTYIIEEK